ncbi:MAG: hypothetical protein R3281_03380 [Balneolaceae bacterium]|nr:hypothetical protein [Balneolaceae bacterium]
MSKLQPEIIPLLKRTLPGEAGRTPGTAVSNPQLHCQPSWRCRKGGLPVQHECRNQDPNHAGFWDEVIS